MEKIFGPFPSLRGTDGYQCSGIVINIKLQLRFFCRRNELCQKFAKSMNKAVRDDLVAVRCERAYKLNELPAVLST